MAVRVMGKCPLVALQGTPIGDLDSLQCVILSKINSFVCFRHVAVLKFREQKRIEIMVCRPKCFFFLTVSVACVVGTLSLSHTDQTTTCWWDSIAAFNRSEMRRNNHRIKRQPFPPPIHKIIYEESRIAHVLTSLIYRQTEAIATTKNNKCKSIILFTMFFVCLTHFINITINVFPLQCIKQHNII